MEPPGLNDSGVKRCTDLAYKDVTVNLPPNHREVQTTTDQKAMSVWQAHSIGTYAYRPISPCGPERHAVAYHLGRRCLPRSPSNNEAESEWGTCCSAVYTKAKRFFATSTFFSDSFYVVNIDVWGEPRGTHEASVCAASPITGLKTTSYGI